MDTLATLQAYWWLLIAILGAALVFLLFVQGGQSMLYCKSTDIHHSRSIRRRFLRCIPLVLQHQFRRCLLAVDAHSAELCHTSFQL